MDAIRVGDWVLKDVPVATFEQDERETLGVLSNRLFRDRAVTLDPVSETMTIESTPSRKGATVIPMDWECGTPAIPANFGPFVGTWGIDSGAYTSTRRIPTPTLEKEVKDFPDGKPGKIRGVGGTRASWVVEPGVLELGDQRVPHADLLLIAADELSPYRKRQGQLGNRVLNCFTTTFDFPGAALHLTPVDDLDRCALPEAKPLFSWGALGCYFLCPGLPILGGIGWVVGAIRRRRRYADLGMNPID